MIKSLYPTFRHWSDGGSVYILSDLHMNDSDCKLINPAWITPEHQIFKINSRVTKNDTLILLGDHGDPDYLRRIKCRNIISIYGNHDKPSTYTGIFKEEYDGPLFISDRIVLSHEPLYGLENFALNIHGHCHNGDLIRVVEQEDGKTRTTHINLAADVADYNVMNLGEAIKAGILAHIPTIHRYTIERAKE